MRGFIAALSACGIGFFAIIFMAQFESVATTEPLLPRSDVGFWIFACAWFAEAMAMMVISMYRITPFLARVMGDAWEAERIERARGLKAKKLERLSSYAIVLRRITQVIDLGSFSVATAIGLSIASMPFWRRIRINA